VDVRTVTNVPFGPLFLTATDAQSILRPSNPGIRMNGVAVPTPCPVSVT
jgi:hypothetical protein